MSDSAIMRLLTPWCPSPKLVRSSSCSRLRLDDLAFGEYHRRSASQRIVYLRNGVRVPHEIKHFSFASLCFDRCSIRDVLGGLPPSAEPARDLNLDRFDIHSSCLCFAIDVIAIAG